MLDTHLSQSSPSGNDNQLAGAAVNQGVNSQPSTDNDKLILAALGHDWVKKHGYPPFLKAKQLATLQQIRVIQNGSGSHDPLELMRLLKSVTMSLEAISNRRNKVPQDETTGPGPIRNKKTRKPSSSKGYQQLAMIFSEPSALEDKPQRQEASGSGPPVASVVEHESSNLSHDLTPTLDAQVVAFFTARNYRNPLVLGKLCEAGFSKYELRSMKGLHQAIIVERFKAVLPPTCQAPAQIESLAFAVSYASDKEWESLES